MANSSAMATGHYLGDSGTFSNTIFTGYTVAPAGDTVTPFIENDQVIGDIDEHFAGNYLNEDVLLQLARAKGYSTAAIGKVGTSTAPGTLHANVAQQSYFANVASKVVLPMFKDRNKPFVLVFWSRDPAG